MPAARKPSLRFFHSAPLRTRTNKLLDAIDHDEEPTRHTAALAALVVDLTEAGMSYYFIKALQTAKVGFVARQTANLGVAGALRIMSPMIRSILGGTNAAQLRIIARHMRQLMA